MKSGEVWAGAPAKLLRKLSAEEKGFVAASADNYAKLATEHRWGPWWFWTCTGCNYQVGGNGSDVGLHTRAHCGGECRCLCLILYMHMSRCEQRLC